MESCSIHILSYIYPYVGFCRFLYESLVTLLLVFWFLLQIDSLVRICTTSQVMSIIRLQTKWSFKWKLQEINRRPRRRLYQTTIWNRVCKIVRFYQRSWFWLYKTLFDPIWNALFGFELFCRCRMILNQQIIFISKKYLI